FAGPSFHEGSKPPPGVAVCAKAKTGRSGPDNAGRSASVESRTRRWIPEEGAIGCMFDLDAAGKLLDGGFQMFISSRSAALSSGRAGPMGAHRSRAPHGGARAACVTPFSRG